METLICRACGAVLNIEDLDRRLAVVHCSHCGGIYDLTKQRDASADTSDGQLESTDFRALSPRSIAALPPKFRMVRNEDNITISWPWLRITSFSDLMKVINELGFFVVWFGALYMIYQIVTFLPIGFDGGHIFPLLVVAGLGFGYVAIAKLANRTSVTLDPDLLKIRYGPLPWRPGTSLNRADVEQFCGFDQGSSDVSGRPLYQLSAVLRDHRVKHLLSGLNAIEQVLYLEQEFEMIMNIRDRPVAGEVMNRS